MPSLRDQRSSQSVLG